MQNQEDTLSLLDRAMCLLQEARDLSEGSTTPPEIENSLGTDTIGVIWVSCRGLADLAGSLNVSRVDKISTTTEANVASRLAILGRDEYGSLTKNADGRFEAHPGFRRWIAQAIHIARRPRDPAIVVRPRSVIFARPPSLTRRQFDLALRNELKPWSLEARCDGEDARRYTRYVDLDRVSLASEFVVNMNPRTDGERLLEAVETILARHR